MSAYCRLEHVSGGVLSARSGRLWMALAAISFSIGVLQHTINRNMRFLYVPSVTWPLLFLSLGRSDHDAANGRFGLRPLGSDTHGGRNYIMFFAMIIGYFALISRPIPPNVARLYVALFSWEPRPWPLAICPCCSWLPTCILGVSAVKKAALQGATF